MNELTPKQTMTSLDIAELTGKNHKDVMRAIRTMEPAWEKVTGRKFTLSEFKDVTGRKLPMYELTKKECLYIATKFNDEARAKLIDRWEKLETAIQKPQSTLDILELTVRGLREQQTELTEIKTQIKQIEGKINNASNYVSIMGYARLNNIQIGLQLAAKIGKKAKELCVVKGFEIETVPDPRFGKVNIYPFEIVDIAFNETKAA